MKTISLLTAALLLCIPAFARERNPNIAMLTGNPEFKKYCTKCHGGGAEGRHFTKTPSLVSDKVAAAPPEDLRNIITNGKGNMPRFGDKISATDIDAIVQQIKAANAK